MEVDETDGLVRALGEHITEMWYLVGEWTINLLDESVTVRVEKLMTGNNVGKFMASGSHGIISEEQASPYQSIQLADSVADALSDWALGISNFIGNSGARMVQKQDD